MQHALHLTNSLEQITKKVRHIGMLGKHICAYPTLYSLERTSASESNQEANAPFWNE